jgi:hypothetical protein
MKKLAILTAVFCLFSLSAFAQSKASFAGNWELDVNKSKLPEMSRVEAMSMKIAQTDKDLKIEQTTKRTARPEGEGNGIGAGNRRGNWGGGFGGDGVQTFNYSLEGKETQTEGVPGIPAASATLKANLEKDGKLKLTSTRKFNSQMGEVTVTTKETWELLDGGKTLKVVRETENRRGLQTSEMYFTKK